MKIPQIRIQNVHTISRTLGTTFFTSHFPQKITSVMKEDVLILDIVLIQTIQYHNKRPSVYGVIILFQM